MHLYFQQIEQLLHKIATQQDKLQTIAQIIAKKLEKGGIIQLFGAGHSFLLAEEAFYRAGGLVPVKPIYIPSLMISAGAIIASQNEKEEGLIANVRHLIDIQKEDVVIVISTSGRNAAPIEMALEAKERGAYVISLQSLCYSELASTHSSNLRLEEVVDDVLNTYVPVGDGVLRQESYQYGSSSTVVGAALLNGLMSIVIEQLLHTQHEVPVFVSNNIEQEKSKNEAYCQKYSRIAFK